jgi:Molecular chaperone (small heat shock protein)
MTFDFSPLYRSTVGFDHLASLLDSISHIDRSQPSYPPYNIELLEKDKYRITMAVAGFTEDEIVIENENNTLTVSATRAQKEGEPKRTYLHQGIAERSFKRQFRLADHVKVLGATLVNGLLHIELERQVPEEMKPRRIPINATVVQSGQDQKLLKYA